MYRQLDNLHMHDHVYVHYNSSMTRRNSLYCHRHPRNTSRYFTTDEFYNTYVLKKEFGLQNMNLSTVDECDQKGYVFICIYNHVDEENEKPHRHNISEKP